MPDSPICVDASFVLRLIIEAPGTQTAQELWQSWHREQRRIVVPVLFHFEVTNALYRYAQHDHLTLDEAEKALQIIQDFNIEPVSSGSLHRRAMQLAHSLGQGAAYDAHYLALSESLGAEFWTADGRLARSAHESLPWVHLLDQG